MSTLLRRFTVASGYVAALLVLSVTLTRCDSSQHGPATDAEHPMNVVLISVDTLRADHMGIYGYHRSTTPFIDSFFADGVIFERCISQAPWTLPAHVSIFTGEYSSTHGALDKHECNLLDPATETFADVLHQAGYTTAAFTGGGFVSQEYGYHTFDVFDDSGKRNARNFAAMRRWITTKATEPFFLFWHEYWPHCPYTPPPEHDIFADPEYAGPIDVEPEPGGSHMAKRCGIYYQKMLPKLGPEDIQHIIDKYDGCIRQSDALVKRLIDTLGSEGLLDRTLVVFTSDHGESFADREHESRIGHHGMYEEVLRVPLLLWGPSLPMETPATVSKLVESIDIGPTILGQVGLSFSSEVAGTDLFAGAAGPTAYAEQFNFANRDELSVQTARQKVIHRTHRSDSTEEWEYYQLDQDPGEQRPLSTEQRDAQLLALANAVHELLPEEIRCGAAADIEDAKREELEALGYVVTTDGSKPD